MSAGKDLFNNLVVAKAINPASITATTTPISVDRQGFGSVLAVVQTGAMTTADASNFFLLEIFESDDGVTFTKAADTDVIGSDVNLIVKCDGAPKANGTFTLGYKGAKRYVSVQATETGTSVIVVGASIVLGSPYVV
jgi:hypothetical protein